MDTGKTECIRDLRHTAVCLADQSLCFLNFQMIKIVDCSHANTVMKYTLYG